MKKFWFLIIAVLMVTGLMKNRALEISAEHFEADAYAGIHY